MEPVAAFRATKPHLVDFLVIDVAVHNSAFLAGIVVGLASLYATFRMI